MWGIFLLFFLSGCATTLPKIEIYGKKSLVYEFPALKADLFNAITQTLKLEQIPIAVRDEAIGKVKTELFPIGQTEFRNWTGATHLPSTGHGKLDLEVRQGKEFGTSELEIATHFTKNRQLALPSGKELSSTGIFEEALAAKIHTSLLNQKYPTLFQLAIGCYFEWDQKIEHYRVKQVKPFGLGEEQGFLENDVVVKLDEVEATMGQFFPYLAQIRENKIVRFTILRQGAAVELPIHIFFLSSDLPWVGIRTERDVMSRAFTVEEVAPSSPAGMAGLRPGDKILEEKEIPMTSWRNYYEAVTSTKPGETRKLVIERSGERLTISVILKSYEPETK